MKYQVLDPFKVKTSQGEMELQPGQIITLQTEKAVKLLNEGRITPVQRVAYKVYSEVLQSYLWIVDTDKDMHSLRGQNVTEAIYTAGEIAELKKMPKEGLKEIHKVKEIFENSKVESSNDERALRKEK